MTGKVRAACGIVTSRPAQKPQGHEWGPDGFLRLSLLKTDFFSACGPRTQPQWPQPLHHHRTASLVSVLSKCLSYTQVPLPQITCTLKLRIIRIWVGFILLNYSQTSQAMVGSQKYNPTSPVLAACVGEARQGRGSPGLSEHPFPFRSHQSEKHTGMLSGVNDHFASYLELREVVTSQTLAGVAPSPANTAMIFLCC